MHRTKLIKLNQSAARSPSAAASLCAGLTETDPASAVIVAAFPPGAPAEEFLRELEAAGIRCFDCPPPDYDPAAESTLSRKLAAAAEETCGAPAVPVLLESRLGADRSSRNKYLGWFAAHSGVQEIQIWTDTSGFLSADPKFVPTAFTIPELSFEEALELGHTGARALSPPLLVEARDADIPIRMAAVDDPRGPGTLIHSSSRRREFPVTGLSSIAEAALVRIEGSGLPDAVGMAGRVFGALARAGINVILISQTASEHSICFAVDAGRGADAANALHEEFAAEYREHQLEPVQVECHCSIVAAIGEGMRGRPGVSGKLFHALGQNGINIRAIAQGTSERNVSVVVARDDEAKALNVLHDAFVLSPVKTAHLFLVGTGQVGRTLLAQMDSQAERLADRRVQLRLAGAANSRKMIFNKDGLPAASLEQILEENGEKSSLPALVEHIRQMNLPNCIFVDCTASQDVANLYDRLLSQSISVVTPNKKAHSGPLERYAELKQLASNVDVKFYYETTVGAGLPIIGTLHDLLASGDQVLRVEAVLSGTLSYLFNTFQAGRKFSEIVRDAREKGYTEPDPRDDLSGTDVARKLLILAREIGWPAELERVEVESLIPEVCRGCASAEEFLERLPEADAEFEKRRAESEERGCVLRYIGSLTSESASVSLQAVDREHPFFQLSGSDNIIAFTTQRYSERPLVVKGPGAGTEVTAAGVLADVLRVVSYLE